MGGRLRSLCLVGVLLGASLLVPAILVPAASEATQLSPNPQEVERGPISIEGNGGFTPENGVVAGSGTSADPFVIEGWHVRVAIAGGVAISIRNTTAPFVLRNSSVGGPIFEYDGIRFVNVTHGTIAGGYWTWLTRDGLVLEDVQDVTVVGCMCVRSANWAFTGRSLEDFSFLGGQVTDNAYPIRVEGGRNLTFDGITIRDNNAAGIDLIGVQNATVTGNVIAVPGVGVSLAGTSGVRVEDNDFAARGYVGIEADRAQGDVYRGNRISDQQIAGIDLWGPQDVTIVGNSVGSGGIRIHEGRDLVFQGNTISGGALSLHGSAPDHFASHAIGEDNLVNGLPLRYVANAGGLEIVGGAYGQLIFANATQIRLASLTFRDTVGPHLFFVEGVEIDAVRVERPTGIGIDAVEARGLTIRNVWLGDTTDIAIQISGGADVRLEQVVARGGIALSGISGGWVRASATGASIGQFVWGIRADQVRDFAVEGNSLLHADYGITIHSSENVSIVENTVESNSFFRGVGVDVHGTRDVAILENVVTDNYLGIRLQDVAGADVFGNRIRGSSVHASDDRGAENLWDHGYPAGGNYWGDYMWWDDCEGPAQDVCPNVPVNDLVDGIGDRPYEIDADSRDRFPMMNVDLQDELPHPFAVVVAPPPVDPGDTVVIRLDGSYDRDGMIVACEWDFGDGTLGSEAPCPASVSHVYSSPNSYLFTLTVIDNRGGRGTAGWSIQVEGSPFRPYVRPDEFRLPVPAYWGWSENVTEAFHYGQKGVLLRLRGGPVIELLLVGGYNRSRATIFVDTDVDPTAREDESYLNDTAYQAFDAIRRHRSDATMEVPPAYRTVSGHLSVDFVVRYGAEGVLQKFVIVVSEPHRRIWLLSLDGLGVDFAPLDAMFEQMIAGFEITRPAPSATPPWSFVPLDPPAVAAVSGTAVGIALIAGVLLLRNRGVWPRRPLSGAVRPFVPSVIRFCSKCGVAVVPGDSFCGTCGEPVRSPR